MPSAYHASHEPAGVGIAARVRTAIDNRSVARTALEQVCARGDMTLAAECYAESFADHVGRLEYHGLDGVQRSTSFYRTIFEDLAFEVVDQVAEDDRVASRWVLSGSNRGRRVSLGGITISRLHDGLIVEDWSSFDTLDLLRALGLTRTLLSAPRMLGALLQARANRR
jgi:predicted ester cyclase